jgi:hypothetical protein
LQFHQRSEQSFSENDPADQARPHRPLDTTFTVSKQGSEPAFFSSPASSSRVSEMDMTARLTGKTLSSSRSTRH